MKEYISKLISVALFVSSLIANIAFATESNKVITDNVKARFISQYSHVQAGQDFYVLLEIDIRAGWHTYWRNPGDSGQATSIKWQLPDGVNTSDIEWPYPERQYMGPVANYGYHGVALHRIKFTVDKGLSEGQVIPITANAVWLVCEEECIPEKGQFQFEITVAGQPTLATEHKTSFGRVENLLPKPLAVESSYQYLAATETSAEKIRFDFAPSTKLVTATKIEYFPYEWGLTQPPAQQDTIIEPEFISLTTHKGDLRFKETVSGVLVASDQLGKTTAYEVQSNFGVLNTGELDSQNISNDNIGIFSAVILALLGGLILNLMPCVFPVLSMKALSLISHANQEPAVIKRHGLVYTLGILVSFAALAIALIVIKQAGHHIGWGFQLQSPLFVAAVVVIIFTLGLSLAGFIEIGTSLMGTGSSFAESKGYKGSFFTGVLAVIVATPCTAPFMGPAVGFALTQTAFVTLLVLLMLGVGLALPYLLLCFVPALSKHLPKPGLWMKKLQEFLAFPMFITAAWLIWVFGLQTNMNQIFILLITLILVSLLIWLWKVAINDTKKRVWFYASIITLIIVVIAITVAFFKIATFKNATTNQAINQPATTELVNFESFSPERLQELRSSKSPVFINMTAAWCITCLANERVALSTAEFKSFFKQQGITYLKGDWTNQDPVITSYLESFSRSSVPLYVYYPSNTSAKPLVLPQILTTDSVIEFIKAAESKI